MISRRFVKMNVTCDPLLKSYPAYVMEGQLWNGFLVPYFTPSVAKRIVHDVASFTIDGGKWAFCVLSVNPSTNRPVVRFMSFSHRDRTCFLCDSKVSDAWECQCPEGDAVEEFEETHIKPNSRSIPAYCIGGLSWCWMEVK